MNTALLAILCLLLQAAAKPAALQGRVIRAGSSAPIAHARIVVAKVGGTQGDYRTAITDSTGRFAIPDLSPGTYRVYATREGYLQAEYGRRGVAGAGVPVVLTEGQTSPDLAIGMTPTGAIAGRVSERGRPLRYAWVRALKARYSNGERNLAVTEWTQTDDRGEYRLFGLSPGLYYVVAVPRDRPRIEGNEIVMPVTASNANTNRTSIRSALSLESIQTAAFDHAVYPPIYHPGTTDSSVALPIEVRGGETAMSIDLAMAASPTFHLRGRATAVGLETKPALTVGLYPVDGGTLLRIPSPVIEADGSFDFARVPPGRYFLSVQSRVPPGPLMRDAVEVDVVDRDVEASSISLRPGVTVRGRLTIEGRAPPTTGPVGSVQLLSRVGFINFSTIRFQPDGTFAIENVIPRDYRFQILGPRAGWVRSARYGEDDVLNGPVRITADQQGRELVVDLGEGAPALDAFVVDTDRRPAPGVLVVAVPDAARRNQSRAYRSAATGSDGRARLEGLVPGEYTIFASESIEAGDWQDPAVLQRHEGRGTVVRVREGQTPVVTLRIQ